MDLITVLIVETLEDFRQVVEAQPMASRQHLQMPKQKPLLTQLNASC